MITKFRIGAAGVALATAFGMSSAAHAATASSDAQALILEALQITNTEPLDFGDIAVNGAGTVVVAADGSGATCSVNLVCAGNDQPASFDLEGAANLDVSISLGSIVNLTGPGAPMTLSLLTSSEGASTTLDAGGLGSFDVGGTLTVNAGQVAGWYTGSFVATVLYQ